MSNSMKPLQWKRRVSTTGPLRKSSEGFNYEHIAETPHTGSLAEEPVSTCVLFSSWSRHHLPGQPPLGIPCLGFIRHGRKRARVGRRGMEAGFQLKSKQSGSVTHSSILAWMEKTLESPLDFKEIQPAHPKGDQSLGVHWKD